jgi:hypothetical protein
LDGEIVCLTFGKKTLELSHSAPQIQFWKIFLWVSRHRGLLGLPPRKPQRGSGALHGMTGHLKPWPRLGMWLFKLGAEDPHSGKDYSGCETLF